MRSEWMSLAECAREVGVSSRSMLDWIAQGKVRAKRFGPKCIRVHTDEWARFLRETPDHAPAA